MKRLPFEASAKPLRWIDGRPLLSVIEPYRLANFAAFLDTNADSVVLFGRATKKWKCADAMMAGRPAVCENWPSRTQVSPR